MDSGSLPRADCRYCHRPIVKVPEIGWLDPTPGNSYDVCPDSSYGDHEPSDARGDVARFGP